MERKRKKNRSLSEKKSTAAQTHRPRSTSWLYHRNCTTSSKNLHTSSPGLLTWKRNVPSPSRLARQMVNFMVTSPPPGLGPQPPWTCRLCCWKEGEQRVVHRKARSGAPARGGPKRPVPEGKRLQERLGGRIRRGRRSGRKAELRQRRDASLHRPDSQGGPAHQATQGSLLPGKKKKTQPEVSTPQQGILRSWPQGSAPPSLSLSTLKAET